MAAQDKIRSICDARVNAVYNKVKSSGAMSPADLDSLEQVSRILKNLETVTVHGDSAFAEIDLSTEDLTNAVRQASTASRNP